TKEPLIGATVQVVGTTLGVTSDLDGNYELTTQGKQPYAIEVKYVSYKTIRLEQINPKDMRQLILNFEMEADTKEIDEVMVIGRKNLENEKALLLERQSASIAIENMGAKEMSLKGISTVADGVKKITGISLAEAGQLVVRGLGDRYSATTLNGLPIASPNPDNKLIPLDLFPSSTVKNITVSKVYQASEFADYSGAHIDISTRENTGNDFFSLSLSTGGKVNTLLGEFYQSDRIGTRLKTNSLSSHIKDMSASTFADYAKKNDPFGTSFSISNNKALPDLGGTIGIGKSWDIGKGKLSILGSLGIDNEQQTLKDAYITTLNAQGEKINNFAYDGYTTEQKMAALVSVGYSFRKSDRVGYTLFFARNAVDDYKLREGYDYEGVNLIGSNSTFHVYRLLNHQLSGLHQLSSRWKLNWSGSYGSTSSDEPDRRQVMYRRDEDKLSLFKLNKQETMRYFGELSETEWVGDVRLSYQFGENNLVRFGGTYKDKSRDYYSTRFYYNLNKLNPSIDNIYNTDGFLNQENIANGNISLTKDAQPKSKYFAGNTLSAAFAEVDYYPLSSLLVNAGLRYEQADQWVRYWTDGGTEKKSTLNKGDFFPALNLKYTINPKNILRLSASRTVTRPSFIEMAPFLYKESYGSAEVRGNDALQNGYNVNIDLRYEYFAEGTNDLFAVTAYYKSLLSPIERVQESSGGSAVHSFRNADNGLATGLEIEFRKEIIKDLLRIGMNASYMYTNVVLPENGGVYTDSQRALQGASPYLVNADVSYTPQLKSSRLALSLLYNLQGPRIQTVGIYGVGNIVQSPLHALDFIANCQFNQHWSVKLQVKDLLNSTVRFTQEVKKTGEEIEVEAFQPGIGGQLSVTYQF
ncbi:MAG: TonB-dependent receptor, partial [Bacteroidaceae bacterium]